MLSDESKTLKVICKNSKRVYWEKPFCSGYILPIFMQDWPNKAVWLTSFVITSCSSKLELDWVYNSFGFQLTHIIASLITILLQLQKNSFFFFF